VPADARAVTGIVGIVALLLTACGGVVPPVRPTATPTARATTMPTATATATALPTPTVQGAARFADATCRFAVPAGASVSCGDLTVPLDHARPAGPTITLHVAIYASTAAQPADDPIVYLEGGPGGHALARVALMYDAWFLPLLAERPLIVVDQRGAGASRPALDCPELSELGYAWLDEALDAAGRDERWNEAWRRCASRLRAAGIEFGAYHSAASAADLEALRQVLGIAQWNVFGVSYGTRLALTLMRDHPAGIRSVILDSVVPLEASETAAPARMAAAFAALFAGCAADAACAAAYPALDERFAALVARLDERPVLREVADPTTGERHRVVLSGTTVIALTGLALASAAIVPALPLAISAAERGVDYSLFTALAINAAAQHRQFSYGLLYAVRCHEEIPFDAPQALATAGAAWPALRGAFDVAAYGDACAALDVPAAPARENQPVDSDRPALILAGALDPITPPGDAGRVAGRLSAAQAIEFPAASHGVAFDQPCARAALLAFVRDPLAPVALACLDEQQPPAFIIVRF
jgi:pimeloyl-ACP methyl ester carboxylesterase